MRWRAKTYYFSTTSSNHLSQSQTSTTERAPWPSLPCLVVFSVWLVGLWTTYSKNHNGPVSTKAWLRSSTRGSTSILRTATYRHKRLGLRLSLSSWRTTLSIEQLLATHFGNNLSSSCSTRDCAAAAEANHRVPINFSMRPQTSSKLSWTSLVW